MKAGWGEAGAFIRGIDPQTEGCVLWPFDSTNAEGYGVVWWQGRTALAHRAAYMHHVGELVDGFHLDHLCHSRDESCVGGRGCPHRLCVNPSHLEEVTALVNMRRSNGLGNGGRFQAAKTHCVHGHAFTPENVRINPQGRRICRTCAKTHWQASRRRKKELA